MLIGHRKYKLPIQTPQYLFTGKYTLLSNNLPGNIYFWGLFFPGKRVLLWEISTPQTFL